MGLKHYILVAWLFFWSTARSQNNSSSMYIDSVDYREILDSLKGIYDQVDALPEKYQLSFYTALAFFPELAQTKVRVKHSSIATTLCIRPTILSGFFKKREYRTYVLRINKDDKHGNIELKDVPYQAAIGLFGHEFSHIIDYNQVGVAGLFARAWWYLFDDTHALYEHEIDQLTIDRGLGWQLHEWSRYVLNSTEVTDSYKKLKRRNYLTPNEIMAIINRN